MPGELRTFDPDQVQVTWARSTGAAIDLTEGLIDGPGAIAEAKDGPAWTRRGDRKGNMVRNKRPAKGGTLTLTYVAESEIQELLTAAYLADQETEAEVGDIVVKDLNGSTIMIYHGAFIEDDPTLSYGDTAADRPYVFGFAERVPFLQGAEVT